MREDVYKVVKAVFEQTPESSLSPEDYRLLKKMELEFRRNGLALPPAQRDELKTLKKRLSDLCIDFQKNINEDKTSVKLTKEELDGMPDDFISGLQKETVDGVEKYIVTMKYPDLFPMMNRAKKETVRQLMDVTNSTRCEQNVKLLEEASSLSHSFLPFSLLILKKPSFPSFVSYHGY
jgi:Zn-dependent oligopeptidase